jgi:hypothetical protein
MKKVLKIRDLNSLDAEIYRLRVENMKLGKKLADNINYFQENAFTLLSKSVFCRDRKNGDEKTKDGFFTSRVLNRIISKIADRMSDRAGDGIDSLLDKKVNPVFCREDGRR